MTRIDVDNETAEKLAAHAAEHGLTPGEYLRLIVPPVATNAGPVPSMEELDAELEKLALELPTLPDDFSRTDIYEDHD